MTHDDVPGDSTTAGTRNIDLAFDLIRAQLADPALADEIPNGATVVLLPEDDQALAEANRELGLRLLDTGRNVYFRHAPARRSALTAN